MFYLVGLDWMLSLTLDIWKKLTLQILWSYDIQFPSEVVECKY